MKTDFLQRGAASCDDDGYLGVFGSGIMCPSASDSDALDALEIRIGYITKLSRVSEEKGS